MRAKLCNTASGRFVEDDRLKIEKSHEEGELPRGLEQLPLWGFRLFDGQMQKR